jgi:hypothetical protein
LLDLLRESAAWADAERRATVTAADVDRAITLPGVQGAIGSPRLGQLFLRPPALIALGRRHGAAVHVRLLARAGVHQAPADAGLRVLLEARGTLGIPDVMGLLSDHE